MEENIVKGLGAPLGQLSPLVLAYMGDVLYEMKIREHVVRKNPLLKISDIHKAVTGFARAESQAKAVLSLQEELTEEEWDIVKRGRNQKPTGIPKKASVSEYRYATGFEALLGALYHEGKLERAEEIIAKAIKIIEEN